MVPICSNWASAAPFHLSDGWRAPLPPPGIHSSADRRLASRAAFNRRGCGGIADAEPEWKGHCPFDRRPRSPERNPLPPPPIVKLLVATPICGTLKIEPLPLFCGAAEATVDFVSVGLLGRLRRRRRQQHYSNHWSIIVLPFCLFASVSSFDSWTK